ncbi:hypothetical protein H0H92_003987 [Tricholoma furcatifolium]|nr:hypothetical protein H0H92_003987 [Tricholoma furcatifolium]
MIAAAVSSEDNCVFHANPHRDLNAKVRLRHVSIEPLLKISRCVTLAAAILLCLYSKDTSILAPTSESDLIAFLQQLVEETGYLPARFNFAGVTVSGAAKTTGGSADIYQGYIQGKSVGVKKIGLTQDSQDRPWERGLSQNTEGAHLPLLNMVLWRTTR